MNKNQERLLAALDRGLRTGVLDVREHRPRSRNAALRRDEIAQWLIFAEASRQAGLKRNKRESIIRALGVSKAYAYRALQKMDPERRRDIEMSAKRFTEMYRVTIK